MLRVLADVDEAADKAAALARVDPDMATAIRRLRDLPDPPPPALRPKAARGRKPPRVKGSK